MAKTIESGPDNVVTIKVVGIGGAGNNVVNRMVKSGTQGVEFVSINTDKPALSISAADQKVQIGEKLTHGQGAGANPDVGKKAAEESRNNIAQILENTDMVFIAAGMGGGTGTGASPVVADIAREQGILTVGVVTKPFSFEGKRRMDQANEGISNLLSKVDALLIIPNDRLKHATDQKLTFANAFEIADDVLLQAVNSISELIKNTGFINLDFADVTAIMKDAGYAHMGVGHAAGKGKAEEAAHPDANIIFGATFDETMDDEMRVTVIATRFDEKPTNSYKNPDRRAVDPASLFSGEKKATEPAPQTQPAPEPAREPAKPAQDEEDPFIDIFKIFNS